MPPTEYYPSFWPRVTFQWVRAFPEDTQAGSCVANALCTLKEIHEYRQYGSANRYSIGYIFGNRSGDESNDYMLMADALDHLVSDGVPLYLDCPENGYSLSEYKWSNDSPYIDNKKWPYPDTRMYFDRTHDGDYIMGAKTFVQNNENRDMYRSKISSWTNHSADGISTTTLDAIKQSVIDSGGALVHTYIANNFDNLGGDGCTGIVPSDVDYNLTLGEAKSSHLMVILGWKIINSKTYWIVHNNWGDWWWGDENRRGICYMPIDYENVIQYYTVVDSSSRQNAPAPVSCEYTPDSQYPDKYINAHAPEWTNVGELYFDKRLNYGPYAGIWRGPDLYNGGEKYHDISEMTAGQTVQFRAKFTNVQPWLTEAGGAETWGWAYSDVYTKTGRPGNFTGFNWITSGGSTYDTVDNGDGTYTAYIMPHTEWNDFTAKINEFRAYKGLSAYSFTQVSRDTLFSSGIINQAVSAINAMGFSISAASGNISHDFLVNKLKGSLNSIQ